MKQIVQSYKTGDVTLENVPAPLCTKKSIIVRNCHSLISVGTEKSTIELGQKSLLGKARARPDLLKRVIEKARTEGIKKTFTEAMGRLDTPTPLGYSAAGVVMEAGIEAHGFAPGDRVAIIGQGFASHAELVCVPIHLATKISNDVSTESAAFGMLGCIALHGIRAANLTFGAQVGVIGLGLLGQLTVQMLKAYGCDVFAFDINAEKIVQATRHGANCIREKIDNVDAVIITAATDSNAPVELAIEWCRPKAKIVIVGVCDIHPDRNALWKKELELVVSKAAGPGSLDDLYEKKGIDFPIELVRWTENRNLQEFVRLLEKKLIDVAPLITHRFSIDDAENVYRRFLNNELDNPIGMLFSYSNKISYDHTVLLAPKNIKQNNKNEISVSVIGAGVFGKSVFLPVLSKNPSVKLKTLITSSGINAQHQAKRFGFAACGTDMHAEFDSTDVDAIIALAPHSQHANIILKALQYQKPLLIEKPLCAHPEELSEIQKQYAAQSSVPLIMIGHNRRYSPHTQKIKSWLASRREPAVLSYRVNAGYVPQDHWVHSDAEGRSRIVGEMTHFIDWIAYVLNEKIISVYAKCVEKNSESMVCRDNIIVTLGLSGGSVATIIYSAMGDRSVSREYAEIFFDKKIILFRDFRESELVAQKKSEKFKTREQAMGYQQEIAAFVLALQQFENSIPAFELEMETMRIVFLVEKFLVENFSECKSDRIDL